MKRGKEIKLTVPGGYRMVAGTVNNKSPRSIYLSLSAWAEPKIDDELNYERIISRLKKKIKARLYTIKECSRFYKNNIIVDLDIRHSGVRFNKKSYTGLEVILFQKELVPINQPELKEDLTKISNILIEDIISNDEHFQFYTKK